MVVGAQELRRCNLARPQGFGCNWGWGWGGGGWREEKHTQGVSWSGVGWALFWRNRSSWDGQHGWYRELNIEAGLLNIPLENEMGVITYR